MLQQNCRDKLVVILLIAPQKKYSISFPWQWILRLLQEKQLKISEAEKQQKNKKTKPNYQQNTNNKKTNSKGAGYRDLGPVFIWFGGLVCLERWYVAISLRLPLPKTEDGFGTARPVVPFPLSRCPVPVVPLAVPVGSQRAAAWRTFAFRRHFGKNEVR